MTASTDALFGYAVYRKLSAHQEAGARYFLMLNQREEGRGMEYKIHDTMDAAEEQILDDMGNGRAGVDKHNYVIQALYWDGGTVKIPNSVPNKEVE